MASDEHVHTPCRYNPLLRSINPAELPMGELLDLLITLADLTKDTIVQVERQTEQASKPVCHTVPKG